MDPEKIANTTTLQAPSHCKPGQIGKPAVADETPHEEHDRQNAQHDAESKTLAEGIPAFQADKQSIQASRRNVKEENRMMQLHI